MIQKRLFSQLALAVVAAAVLTACGKKEEAAPAAAAAAPAAKEVTVAYITNGNTNEGWTLINGGAKAAGGCCWREIHRAGC